MLDQQRELLGIAAVRADPAVSAKGDLHTRADRALERTAAAVERLNRLRGDLRRILARRLPPCRGPPPSTRGPACEPGSGHCPIESSPAGLPPLGPPAPCACGAARRPSRCVS